MTNAQGEAGLELAGTHKDGSRLCHITEGKVLFDRQGVHTAIEAGMLHQHLELRSEHQGAVVQDRVIHGLDTHPIARHEEGLAIAVPQGEGKHAAETLDACLAPRLPGMYDHFGVAAGVETVTKSGELGDQLLEVVDLPVEDHHHRLVLVEQRLLPAGDVDDRKAAVRQGNTRLKVVAALVRAPVKLDVVHALHELARERLFRSCIEKSGNAAHSS